jgi:hypothetical protein
LFSGELSSSSSSSSSWFGSYEQSAKHKHQTLTDLLWNFRNWTLKWPLPGSIQICLASLKASPDALDRRAGIGRLLNNS